MYERTLDGIVGLFVPFYDQWKTLLILFFIFTRARVSTNVSHVYPQKLTMMQGSEPIYLHILRPCLKPYVATLDVLMSVTHNIGDFVLLLLSIPVQYVSEQYEHLFSRRTKRERSSRVEGQQPPAPVPRSADETRRPTTDRRSSSSSQRVPSVKGTTRDTRPSTRGRNSSGSGSSRPISNQSRLPSSTRVPSTGSLGPHGRRTSSRTRPSQVSQTPQRTPVFEIWHPSASSRDDPPSGLPTPPVEIPPLPVLLPEETATVDEWRQYPPFPSAYPPTPLPVASRLPSDAPNVAIAPAVAPSFAGIPEEHIDAQVSDPLDNPQDIPTQSEAEKPLSDDGLSDGQDSMEGIEEERLYSSDDMDGDDEDEFNVTLRTPKSQRTQPRRSPLKSLRPSSSGESLASRSTGLSTADDGSTLRTRSSGEETSTTLSVSDASSIAGRKRRLSRSSSTLKGRVKPVDTKSRITKTSSGRNASTVRVRGKFASKDTLASDTPDEDNLPNASGASDDELGVKRRRVPEAAAGFVPRPPRQDDSDRTIRGVPAAKFEVERRLHLRQSILPKSRSEPRVPPRAPLASRPVKANAVRARPMPRSQSTSSVPVIKKKTVVPKKEKTEQELPN